MPVLTTTPAKHLIIQGSLPLALTFAATILGLFVKPPPRTIRLLHNLASGLLLGTVSEKLFPDMVTRSLETPANKLGTAVGFSLAAFTSALIYESREEIRHPDPATRRRVTISRTDVESAVLGFITGSVLFERRLDTLSVPYMVALGCGVKGFVNTLVASQMTVDGELMGRSDRAAVGLAHMSEQAAFFAIALAIVPLTARSVRPIYSLIMAFVATQSISLSIDDILSSSLDEPNLGLALRDYAETIMFFVGEGLVLAARWLNETSTDYSRLKSRARAAAATPTKPVKQW
jgi:hypothetical protein